MDCITVMDKKYNSLRGPWKVAIFPMCYDHWCILPILWGILTLHHYCVSHQEAPPQHTPLCLPTAADTSAQSLWIFWQHSHHNIKIWWNKSINLINHLNKIEMPTALTSLWSLWIVSVTMFLLPILLFIQCHFFLLSLFFEIFLECL